MGAFIISALIAAATLVFCLILILANGSMTAPSQTGYPVGGSFCIGIGLAAVVLASHWLPHVGW